MKGNVRFPFALRSIYFKFEKSYTHRGLDAMQFGIPAEVFQWDLPENGGFCNRENTVRYCSLL